MMNAGMGQTQAVPAPVPVAPPANEELEIPSGDNEAPAPLKVVEAPATGQTFAVKGYANPLSKAEYEKVISDYNEKLMSDGLKIGSPLKTWDGEGEVNGVAVLQCYGKYRADPKSCIRCPLRPHCLHS